MMEWRYEHRFVCGTSLPVKSSPSATDLACKLNQLTMGQEPRFHFLAAVLSASMCLMALIGSVQDQSDKPLYRSNILVGGRQTAKVAVRSSKLQDHPLSHIATSCYCYLQVAN